MTATVAEVALVMFIGMGPLKVLVYYLVAIHDAEAAVARRVAFLAVATATVTALGLVLAGALLARLMHFSNAALVIAGGVVLLAYGLQLVLRAGHSELDGPPPTEASLMSLAVHPMGVPLILNPAGIAAATIFSAEAAGDIGYLGILAAIIVAMAILDFVVLLVARPIGPHLPRQATLVLEQLLGVLLAAVAIELILLGLAAYGILDLPVRH